MSLKRHPWLLVCCVLVDVGLLWLVFATNAFVSCGGIPYMSVDQFVRRRERLSGQDVRVTGFLVNGSLVRSGQPCSARFSLEDHGVVVRVHYIRCALPEILTCSKPTEIPLGVQGRVDDSGEFEAHSIFMPTHLLSERC